MCMCSRIINKFQKTLDYIVASFYKPNNAALLNDTKYYFVDFIPLL